LASQQDVIQFDVSVKNLFLVAVVYTSYDLLEEVTSDILSQLPSLSDVGKQVSTSANFHHEDDMLRRFERFIQLYYIVVTGPAKNIELLHHLTFGGLFRHKLLIYGFQSHKLPRESMNRQVHLAECTFTHHFPDFIELALGFRRLSRFGKTRLNFPLKPGYNACFWSEILIGQLRSLRVYSFFNRVDFVFLSCHNLVR